MTTAQTEARAVGDPYMRIVDFFDRDETAGSFLREDGEGGFVGGIYRMAREIESLRASSAAKDAEIAALKKEAADVVRPFAKAGELFPEPQFDFEQCIYNPAAGPEYALGSSHLRTARSFLNKLMGATEQAILNVASAIAADVLGNDHLVHRLDKQQQDEVHGDVQGIAAKHIARFLSDRTSQEEEIEGLRRRAIMLEKSAGFATDDVARLESALAEKGAALREAERERDTWRDTFSEMHRQAMASEAREAALRKALEFYADVSKYPAPLTGGMGDLWADCGRIARSALASTRETSDAG